MLFYMIKAPKKVQNGHCAVKVKVTEGVWKFSPFNTIQTVMSDK